MKSRSLLALASGPRAHGCLARVGAADAGRARGSQRQHGRARQLAAESKASTCGVFATVCVYFSSATVKTASCSLVRN